MFYVGTTTNMKRRSVPDIMLKASNETRWLYFMSFYTSKKMHRYTWYELQIYH